MKSESIARFTATVGCVSILYVAPATAATEKVLHSFNGTDGASTSAGLTNVNGTFYGPGVYSITPDGTYTVYPCSLSGCDGYDSLTNVHGTLYGTGGGGAHFSGQVFSFTPSTGDQAVLYSFCAKPDCNDGESPQAGVINVKGILYGTTISGGKKSKGVLFSLNLQSRAETVLHTFGGSGDGSVPRARLTNVKGTLYGTTSIGGTGTCNYGGNKGCGTVFSITPDGT